MLHGNSTELPCTAVNVGTSPRKNCKQTAVRKGKFLVFFKYTPIFSVKIVDFCSLFDLYLDVTND